MPKCTDALHYNLKLLHEENLSLMHILVEFSGLTHEIPFKWFTYSLVDGKVRRLFNAPRKTCSYSSIQNTKAKIQSIGLQFVNFNEPMHTCKDAVSS